MCNWASFVTSNFLIRSSLSLRILKHCQQNISWLVMPWLLNLWTVKVLSRQKCKSLCIMQHTYYVQCQWMSGSKTLPWILLNSWSHHFHVFWGAYHRCFIWKLFLQCWSSFLEVVNPGLVSRVVRWHKSVSENVKMASK